MSCRKHLEYKSATGVIIVPYKGDITKVEADGVVTRDDDLMEEESLVTKALIKKYPDFQEKRNILKKKTKFLFFTLRYKKWSIQTTRLDITSKPAKFIFQAIMKQADECEGENWEVNMKTLYLRLLNEAEKHEIKVLAIPLLGSGRGNAKVAAKVAVKYVSDHKPKHLRKVFLITKGKTDISEIISYCARDLTLIHGNQPDGKMDVATNPVHLPGFEKYGTLIVTYSFPSGIQGEEHPNPGKPYKATAREAYLPDSTDGREVLALLRTAFDRKLTFTIGRSGTTGQSDVVKWNCIEHKSKKEGERHGYPDQKYLTRVKDDLAKRGITKGPVVRVASEADSGYAQKMQNDLERLQKKIRGKNLVARENDAKGDCMFKALSQQIEHKLKKKIGHMELRKELVDYLRENPKRRDGTSYKDFLVNETWEGYLDKMATDGQWGDHMMLTATADKYQVAIEVIKPGDADDTPIAPVERRFQLGHALHRHFFRPTFHLGHLLDRHFVSLESEIAD